MFKFKKKRSKTDLEIIADNYILCLNYLCKNKLSCVQEFKDGVHDWVITNNGIIELDIIPHDKQRLTECRNEIECLIADNEYSDEEIINAINSRILNLNNDD